MRLHVIGAALAGLATYSQAAVTVHYFAQTSCNANTALSEYSNAAPAADNTACIPTPPGTAALYIDGVDEGCTVRTYSDASCATNLGLSITAGTCYFKDSSPIGSWRVVCGSSGDATVTVSLTSSATVGTETAPPPADSSTSMDSGSMTAQGTDVGPVLTSVETVTPTITPLTQAAPPTDGAPMPTMMPEGAGGNGSNGTNWSLTHSKLSPSGSPGLQKGSGSGMGTSGAGLRAGEDWRRNVVTALGVVIVVQGVRDYFLREVRPRRRY